MFAPPWRPPTAVPYRNAVQDVGNPPIDEDAEVKLEREKLSGEEGIHIPSPEQIMHRVLTTTLEADMPDVEYDKMRTLMDIVIEAHRERVKASGGLVPKETPKIVRPAFMSALFSPLSSPAALCGRARAATAHALGSFRDRVRSCGETVLNIDFYDHGNELWARWLDYWYTSSPLELGEAPRNFGLSAAASHQPPPKGRPETTSEAPPHLAVVTGGYSGIGAEITRALAASGATVIVPCLDNLRCDVFANAVGPNVHCEHLDLSEIVSIIQFQNKLHQHHVRPNLLIHAAATLAPTFNAPAISGVADRTLGVNTIGPSILSDMMVPLMAESESDVRQIVFLTDHRLQMAPFSAKDIAPSIFRPRALGSTKSYLLSKLCNVLDAAALAHRIDASNPDRGIDVIAIAPAFVPSTNLTKRSPFFRLWARLSPNQATAAEAAKEILDVMRSRPDEPFAYFRRRKPATYIYKNRARGLPIQFGNDPDAVTQFAKTMQIVCDRAFEDITDALSLQHIELVEETARKKYAPQIEAYRADEDLEQRVFKIDRGVYPVEKDETLDLAFGEATIHDIIGGKALGAGPPEGPLIGRDLERVISDVPETSPAEIAELKRRLLLERPSRADTDDDDDLKKEVALAKFKGQILSERVARRRQQPSSRDELEEASG